MLMRLDEYALRIFPVRVGFDTGVPLIPILQTLSGVHKILGTPLSRDEPLG